MKTKEWQLPSMQRDRFEPHNLVFRDTCACAFVMDHFQ